MLCLFADQFPQIAALFLERDRGLRRRFREETITDLMMANLIALGGGRVIVQFPDERATGADMEWNFVNLDDGTFFRLLIQAKRAYGAGGNWKRHCYRELLHLSGSGTKPQGEILCDTARSHYATFPLYAFYHPLTTCNLAQNGGFNGVNGVNLSDGYLIEALIKGAISRAKRTRNKSLGEIHPHLFPLSTLFCPPLVQPMGPMALAPSRHLLPLIISSTGVGLPLPPRPVDIRKRLAEWRRSAIPPLALQDIQADLPILPEVGTAVPDDIEVLIKSTEDGGDRVARESSSKWRVTFLSANPREHRMDTGPASGQHG